MLSMSPCRSLTVVSDTDGDEDLNHAQSNDTNPWICCKRQYIQSDLSTFLYLQKVFSSFIIYSLFLSLFFYIEVLQFFVFFYNLISIFISCNIIQGYQLIILHVHHQFTVLEEIRGSPIINSHLGNQRHGGSYPQKKNALDKVK
jgi:hypothetical protein